MLIFPCMIQHSSGAFNHASNAGGSCSHHKVKVFLKKRELFFFKCITEKITLHHKSLW